MFELESGIYELRYTMKNVELIEAAAGTSIINLIQGVPPLAALKSMLGFALYNEDGNKVSSKRGVELATEVIEKYGMLGAFTQTIERISEDCGFLFREA